MSNDIERQAYRLLGRFTKAKSRLLSRYIGATSQEVAAACRNSTRIVGETSNVHTAKMWRRG
jgi:hypothetical protein